MRRPLWRVVPRLVKKVNGGQKFLGSAQPKKLGEIASQNQCSPGKTTK
jgi:hypothetical protein